MAGYIVLDGQHRVAAVVTELGWVEEQLEVMAYYNLTDARAAEISRRLQDRRNLHLVRPLPDGSWPPANRPPWP